MRALLLVWAATLVVVAPAGAASQTVLIGESFFDPQTVTIDAGDTVTWTNGSGRHTVSSDTGAFDSGPLAEGASFSFRFTAPGTYPYRDRLNPGGGGARGTVIVQAVENLPPTAGLVASAAGAPVGTAIAFDGSASRDVDGTIAHFRWDFDGGGVYETDTGTNPRVARAFPAPGEVRVGLLVEDSGGSSAVAVPVTMTITPAPAARDTVAPDLSVLAGARPSALRAGARTRVRLSVGERATLRVSVERVRGFGRPTVVGRFSRRVARASSVFVRYAAPRGLRPGRYRLLIVAVDAAGNRSAAVRPAFRVVAKRRR